VDHAVPRCDDSKFSKIMDASAGQPTPWIQPLRNQITDKYSTLEPSVKAIHNKEVITKPNKNNTLQLI
jgi:hypothetical protein